MAVVYHFFAVAVLTVHFLFIVWVVGGALITRGRPILRALHILCLVYAVVIQSLPWPPCPLTILETWLEGRAGITPYQGPFLVHYLDALVYPDLPVNWLIAAAAAVCGLNLALYAFRYRHRIGAQW